MFRSYAVLKSNVRHIKCKTWEANGKKVNIYSLVVAIPTIVFAFWELPFLLTGSQYNLRWEQI